MMVFPLIAAAVSAVFSFLLLRQYVRRRRFPSFAWGVALAQFTVASVVVAAAVGGDGWDPTLYRVYWTFGALLNVPWLALGSIALLNRRALTLAATGAVVVGTVWAFIKVWGTAVNPVIVGVTNVPRGHVAWEGNGSVRSMASYYSIPAYSVVVTIAAWTSRTRRGVAPPLDRVRGNRLIALGVTIVAIGSTALARLAQGSAFSITLAAGVSIMFFGFLMTSRPPRHRVEDPGESPT